jgi:hypothetical protein
MQVIEFESVIGNHTITLPAHSSLRPGQSVRVVVMYEPGAERSSADSHAANRLSSLVAHPAAVADINAPLPSPWDAAGWRVKWDASA